MKVIAVDRFEYANKLRLPGEEFDTDNDEHARVLMLAKRVQLIDQRDLKADDDKPKKKHYRTRDLRSED